METILISFGVITLMLLSLIGKTTDLQNQNQYIISQLDDISNKLRINNEKLHRQ